MRSSRSWGPCAHERMAGRAIREPPRRRDGGRVSPGMEPRAPATGAAVRRASRRRLPVRAGHHDAGALATARGTRASVAGGAYGAAHASHGGRRAHVMDGRARMAWPRWTMVPYLGLAMFQSLPLATILTFSDRVIYAGHSSVDDQALAGLIMWVPGSLPLLLGILRLIVELSSRPVAMASSHV